MRAPRRFQLRLFRWKHMAMSRQNALWEEEVSRDQRDSRKEFFTAVPSNLTLSHLKAITRAWKECKAVISRFEPSALQLGVLQQVSQRGPTVALARPQAIRWFQEHLGFPSPVNAATLRSFTQTRG